MPQDPHNIRPPGSADLPSGRVRWRALVIGVLLIPVTAYWVPMMEGVRYLGHPTIFSLYFNVVFTVLCLLALSALVRIAWPSLALTQGELLTVYVMLSIATSLAGRTMVQILVPELGHVFWFATPENDWERTLWRFVPRWLTVDDLSVLEVYYRGGATPYRWDHLRVWIPPVLAWSGFICALLFVMLCINTLIRRQWTDHEKLAYPIIQLPFEMTKADNSFFRNRGVLIGFSIGIAYDLFNGLHALYPVIPPLRVPPVILANVFTEKPWSAMAYGAIGPPRPFIVGLGFLIPLDLLLSCWIFFLFYKAQALVTVALGYQPRPDFPEQATGAYLSLAVFALWASRRRLARAIRNGFKTGSPTAPRAYAGRDPSGDPMGQRTAVAGLVLGSLFIVLFWRQAGMSVAYTIAFFTFFMGVSVAITRIRAELGFPMHDLHFAGPSLLMVHSLGTRPIGARNLTVSSLLYFITRNHNGHVMPHQLEGFKLSQRVGMGNRRLLAAMLLATLVGTLAAFWAMLDLFYREGAGTPHGAGIEPLRRLQTWMSFSHTPDHGATVHITGGLLLGLILMMMRTRFVWWPLHPAGYAVASSYGMRENVTSLFLSWGIKYAVIRFGGLTLHRKFTLVFLGVILGEFTMGSIWTIIGAVYNAKVYDFTSWY